MRRGSKMIVFIAASALMSGAFLYLGIAESSKSDQPADSQPLTVVPKRDSIVARASRPIMVGETITGEMVVNVPFDPARHGTTATPSELIGKVAIRAIPADALIDRTWVDLQSNLAMRVPEGKRAVSIDTNAEIAVAGLLRPGNLVDVQVVYPGADAITGARLEGRSRTETLLQAVQVLAVGETVLGTEAQGGMGTGATAPARTVTLALTPEEVAAFSLAKNTGVLMLSLRNPDDDSLVSGIELASDVMPRSAPAFEAAPPAAARRRPASSRPPAPRQKSEASGKVELIIGGRRQSLVSESK